MPDITQIKTQIQIALQGAKDGKEAVAILKALESEARKTRKSLGDVGGQAKGLKGPLDQLAATGRALKTAFASIGIGLGVSQLFGFLKDAVVGFAKTERSFQALAFQIRALGGDAEANVGKVKAFIDQLSKQTGILDDDLIPAMNRALLTFDNIAEAQEAVSLAARFAEAGIGDLASNVEKLTTAFQTGNLRGLREFGISTKDAAGKTIDLAEAIKRLQEQAATLPDTLNDTQGRLDSIARIWDDFSDTIAAALDAIAERALNSKNAVRDFLAVAGAGAFTLATTGSLFEALKAVREAQQEFAKNDAETRRKVREETAAALDDVAFGPGAGLGGGSALADRAAREAAAVKAAEAAEAAAKKYQKTLEAVKRAQEDVGLDLSSPGTAPAGPELPPTQLLRDFPIPDDPEKEAALRGDKLAEQMRRENALRELSIEQINLESEAYVALSDPLETIDDAINRIADTYLRLVEQGGQWTETLQAQAEAMIENAARTQGMITAQALLRDALSLTADALWNWAVTGDFSAKALVRAIAQQVFGVLTALAIENTIRGYTEAAKATAAAASGNFIGAALHAAAAKQFFNAARLAGAGAAAALAVGVATRDSSSDRGASGGSGAPGQKAPQPPPPVAQVSGGFQASQGGSGIAGGIRLPSATSGDAVAAGAAAVSGGTVVNHVENHNYHAFPSGLVKRQRIASDLASARNADPKRKW